MSWLDSLSKIAAFALLTAVAPTAVAATPGEAPAAAPAVTIDGLLGAFRAMPGFEAAFDEEKHLALLAAPLRSSGRLYFAPPGLFARVVTAPTASSVVITPTSLTMKDATGSQLVDLRARPDVKTFVESFMRVLSGDKAGLEQVYRLTLKEADGGWVLTLTPRGEPLSRLVSALTISGRGLAVEVVRVDEQSGDYSQIKVHDVDPKRRFDPAEKARLFGTPPP